MKIVSLFFGAGDRGLASGLMNCGTRAGLAIGAPLIAWLVVRLTWKGAFFVLGFASLVWLVPWLLVFPPQQSRAANSAPEKERGRWFGPVDRNLLGLCLGQICYSYYWYLLVTWLPDYLVESRHMSIQKAGAFAVIPYLTFAVS